MISDGTEQKSDGTEQKSDGMERKSDGTEQKSDGIEEISDPTIKKSIGTEICYIRALRERTKVTDTTMLNNA